MPGFDAKALLDEYGDHDLVRDLAQLVIDTTPAQLDALRTAIAGGDAAALRATAHRLRGSLVAFGVPDAVETARTLEAMGASGRLAGAGALAEALAKDVQFLRETAKAWLDTGAALP